MQRGSMTDREAYPTAWITLAVLVLLYLLWRFALGAPTVSRCWVWEHWHVCCQGQRDHHRRVVPESRAHPSLG